MLPTLLSFQLRFHFLLKYHSTQCIFSICSDTIQCRNHCLKHDKQATDSLTFWDFLLDLWAISTDIFVKLKSDSGHPKNTVMMSLNALTLSDCITYVQTISSISLKVSAASLFDWKEIYIWEKHGRERESSPSVVSFSRCHQQKSLKLGARNSIQISYLGHGVPCSCGLTVACKSLH